MLYSSHQDLCLPSHISQISFQNDVYISGVH